MSLAGGSGRLAGARVGPSGVGEGPDGLGGAAAGGGGPEQQTQQRESNLKHITMRQKTSDLYHAAWVSLIALK